MEPEGKGVKVASNSSHGVPAMMQPKAIIQGFNGRGNIKDAEMSEVYKMIRKKDKMLEEENKRLNFILHQQEITMEAGREMENEYHQRIREYDHTQMPFAFRVQPIQPNLHERI
ncbi:hypothetical protein U1Q18_045019 [Sarracenia purpurea var. burkii]